MNCQLARGSVKVTAPWFFCASLHLLYCTDTAPTLLLFFELFVVHTWAADASLGAGRKLKVRKELYTEDYLCMEARHMYNKAPFFKPSPDESTVPVFYAERHLLQTHLDGSTDHNTGEAPQIKGMT